MSEPHKKRDKPFSHVSEDISHVWYLYYRALDLDLEPVCGAKALYPSDRQALGLQALAGDGGVSELARQHQVSRKFVYQQKEKAAEALADAFVPTEGDERVLFEIPVTQAWLRQVVLCLMLICHSSMRGVVEFFAAVLDQPIGLGTVHKIMQESVTPALFAENPDAMRDMYHQVCATPSLSA